MKLISTTDFVFTRDTSRSNSENALYEIELYAKFMKRSTNKGMFIPCDEEGNVLEEPKEDIPTLNRNFGYDMQYDVIKMEKYKEAKEKVLFEGFLYQSNYSEKQNKLYEYVTNGHHVFSFEQIEKGTVEGLLTGYKREFLIELKDEHAKKLGLCT